jgi:solute carrier family 25 oxoglutarate transporter 11
LKEPPFFHAFLPFIIGGISGMVATTCIQPIDTIKVRIQIKGEGGTGKSNASFSFIAKEILTNQGVKGFYKGLDSALFR